MTNIAFSSKYKWANSVVNTLWHICQCPQKLASLQEICEVELLLLKSPHSMAPTINNNIQVRSNLFKRNSRVSTHNFIAWKSSVLTHCFQHATHNGDARVISDFSAVVSSKQRSLLIELCLGTPGSRSKYQTLLFLFIIICLASRFTPVPSESNMSIISVTFQTSCFKGVTVQINRSCYDTMKTSFVIII